MKKLAIITTHPIQYYAPLFQLLALRGALAIKVFYTCYQSGGKIRDALFDRDITWDIPLLDGYDHVFVENTAAQPSSQTWSGIDNPTLTEEIQSWKADALLIFGWHHRSHFAAMRFFKNTIPLLFRGDSTLLDEKMGLRRIVRRVILTLLYRYVDYALYVGSANKEYYLKHGLSEKQLVYAPHAIDNERFHGSSYENQAVSWRLEHNISPSDFVILYAGKFEPRKNLLLLISAFKKFSAKYGKRTKLLLVGNGPEEEKLKKDADGHADILFLPFQNQASMPMILRIGDLFCLPSKSETWGLVVNESLACGRPVLVSDKVGCGPDLIGDERVGAIFSCHSEEELVEKMERMARLSLQCTGRKDYLQDHIRAWSFASVCSAIEKTVSNHSSKIRKEKRQALTRSHKLQ